MTDANDEALLTTLVGALAAVRGVAAIALGGSRARGTATPSSDYDIGLYYHASQSMSRLWAGSPLPWMIVVPPHP